MPRAKRTPAKAKAEKVEKAVNEKVVEEKVKEKTRKPYPSIDERIALADAKIQQLEKLNATRQALVEKTAAVLAERQETRRERLIASKDKPAKAHRARKSEQDQQYQELLSALKEKGTSMEELLASLKK